jgi:branched-chain amino acid transport system substrate-binding protein
MLVFGLLMTGIATAGASTRAGSATPGVTKDEIHLGITYVDLSNLGDVVGIDFGDWQKIYEAVIADLNKKGGINGRKVNATFAPVEPVGTVPAQEACVKLTEDEHVFAVTGFFLLDAPLCYVDQHATPVVNGTITKAGLERAKAPWFSLEPGDQSSSQAIDAFASDGAFKGGKLGIIVDAQAQTTYDDVVKPALDRNKVKGTVANITATTGDAVATEQQAGVIAERFRSEGINKVLMVGTSTLQFANALARTDYRPRLIVLNIANLRAFVQNPGSALEVAQKAIGAAPATNFNDPALQKCFGVVTKATGYTIKETVTGKEPDYRSSSEIACRSIALFADIARGAGKNLTVKTFGAAPAKGPLEVPGSGKVTYDTKTKSFVQPVFIWRYDPTTKTVVADAKAAS